MLSLSILFVDAVLNGRSRSRNNDGFDEVRNDAHVFFRGIIGFVVFNAPKGGGPDNRSILSGRVVLSSLEFQIDAKLVRKKQGVEFGRKAQ